MPRFFVDKNLENAVELQITGPDFHHIRHVLRMRPGELIQVSDAAGADLELEIMRFQEERLLARILSRVPGKTEAPLRITLCQGLPKSDKMDLICRQAVELGATEVAVFPGARSDVRLSAEKFRARGERWQKILEAAAKQSGRSRIPRLLQLTSFGELLELLASADFSFFPYECEKEKNLSSWLKEREALLRQADEKARLAFAIGPEGGFAPEEAEAFLRLGIPPLTLGPRILRTETAGAAVLARLLGFLEG